MSPFQFTVQYLEEQDWIRVTAVYDNADSALYHATDLLEMGKCVRLLIRNREIGCAWHTVGTNSMKQFFLDRQVLAPR
jgi:hypothetical protein